MNRLIPLAAALFLAAAFSGQAATPDHKPRTAVNELPRGGDRGPGPVQTQRRQNVRPPQHVPARQAQLPRRGAARQAQRFDWNAYRPGFQPPQWDRYRRDFHMDRWQRNYVSEHRYRYRPYARPSGWFYNRWVYGQIFPRIFWTTDYWLTDYWGYGLIDPPYGYVWVRYGDDAVLVNVQTGLILRVVYNVFY